jgi:ferritin-like metal-binding protein YciE
MPKKIKENTLHGLFLNKLMALYDVENRITKALPKMIKKATDEDLKTAFEDHLTETENHVKRLEQCFELLNMKPKKLTAEAMRGLVDDAEWVIANIQPGPALDAALIAAAQYVEHYEMAGYGSAKEWAGLMEHNDAEELLEQTLEEEKAADEKLNELAKSKINSQVELGM